MLDRFSFSNKTMKTNIFNHRDTDIVICIILVLLKRADGLIHHLNIR